jgi:hypothetical protein
MVFILLNLDISSVLAIMGVAAVIASIFVIAFMQTIYNETLEKGKKMPQKLHTKTLDCFNKYKDAKTSSQKGNILYAMVMLDVFREDLQDIAGTLMNGVFWLVFFVVIFPSIFLVMSDTPLFVLDLFFAIVFVIIAASTFKHISDIRDILIGEEQGENLILLVAKYYRKGHYGFKNFDSKLFNS